MGQEEVKVCLVGVLNHCRSEGVWDPGDGRKLSAPQSALLQALDLMEPRTVSDLARRTGVRPAATSQMLDRLEARGWVRRQRSAKDARVVQVRLTSEGAALLAVTSPIDASRLEALLSHLTHIEQGEVLQGLRLLARAAERS